MMELRSLAEIRGGATPSRANSDYWGGSIPWLTPTDLPASGAGITDVSATADSITEEGLASCSASLLPPGTVLFSSRASIGKVGVAAAPLTTNQGFANLIPRPGVESRYLAWCLHFHADRIAGLAGTTTFKEVTKGALKTFRIPLPAPSEQRRIVEILDQADRLRHLRAEADAKADCIVQALFIKMFGDPAANPKGWPVKKLGALVERIDSGWSPVCENRRAAPGEWGVLRLGAVTTNRYLENENKALPTNLDPRPELEVRSGDLLLTRKNTRELVGACAYVERTRPNLLLSDLVFRLRLKANAEIHPLYLWALLTCSSKRSSIEVLAGGSAGSMPNISKSRLETLGIEKPPYSLQTDFAEAAASCESLREKVKTLQRSIEKIFCVMLHRAFTGDLTARWREAHKIELLQEMEHQTKALAALARPE